MRALARPASACLTLCNYALESTFFREREKVFAAALDVATDLNAGHWSIDLFQVFAALEHSLAGEITSITPKRVRFGTNPNAFSMFSRVGETRQEPSRL
jgi:hypothetical protein